MISSMNDGDSVADCMNINEIEEGARRGREVDESQVEERGFHFQKGPTNESTTILMLFSYGNVPEIYARGIKV